MTPGIWKTGSTILRIEIITSLTRHPTPIDSTAEIYFYHNSIAGGRNALLMAGFNWGYGMRRTYIINNILSSLYAYNSETNLGEKRDVQVFDYNWVGGEFVGPRGWFGNSNILAWPQKQWNDSTLPDFLLPPAVPEMPASICRSALRLTGRPTIPCRV